MKRFWERSAASPPALNGGRPRAARADFDAAELRVCRPPGTRPALIATAWRPLRPRPLAVHPRPRRRTGSSGGPWLIHATAALPRRRIALWSAPFGGGIERKPDGCIAQLVEQLTLNQRVVGSIPTAPTIVFTGFFWHFRMAGFRRLVPCLVPSERQSVVRENLTEGKETHGGPPRTTAVGGAARPATDRSNSDDWRRR